MSDTAGGFLPSPPSSVITSAISILPTTRTTPLRAGSKKESDFIRHTDTQIAHIRRKLAKRYEGEDIDGVVEVDHDGTVIRSLPEQKRIPDGEQWGHGRGYASFKQAAGDLQPVLEYVWVTASPGIQIPYMITLASIVNEMIPAFAPQPGPLFQLLRLLDHAFASLMQQKDVDTGRLLPGFGIGGKARLTDTEKVRINSIVNRARVAVAKRFEQQEPADPTPAAPVRSELQMDSDGEWVVTNDHMPGGAPPAGVPADGDDEDDIEVMVSRVYDQTLMGLGGFTLGSDLGPRTE